MDSIYFDRSCIITSTLTVWNQYCLSNVLQVVSTYLAQVNKHIVDINIYGFPWAPYVSVCTRLQVQNVADSGIRDPGNPDHFIVPSILGMAKSIPVLFFGIGAHEECAGFKIIIFVKFSPFYSIALQIKRNK